LGNGLADRTVQFGRSSVAAPCEMSAASGAPSGAHSWTAGWNLPGGELSEAASRQAGGRHENRALEFSDTAAMMRTP
jgi:hypothetical protein